MDSYTTPFPKEYELYHKLNIGKTSYGNTSPATEHFLRDAPNYTLSEQTADEFQPHRHVPGCPQLPLNSFKVPSFLRTELVTPDLEKLAPYLWLVAKQDSSHVSALTHQMVRGRRVIVTEDPQMHLVWIDDRVFVKPLPKYLVSHSFWAMYLSITTQRFLGPDQKSALVENQALCRAAKGFLRTYALLIRHRSDFELANDHRLLPKGISFKQLMLFLEACKDSTTDADVSLRYHFGELRLSRLNFWSKIFLKRFAFHKVEGQYSAYFARYYGPFLFVFAMLSLLLDSLQVELAAVPILDPNTSQIFGKTFALASKGIACGVIGIFAIIFLYLIMQMMALIARETIFALQHYRKITEV